MTRFTASLDPEHLHPWSFYFTSIAFELRASQTFPLVVGGLVALAAVTAARRWSPGLVILLWFALPLGLMSLGTSKIYHYAYPFLPPLALAAGYLVAAPARLAWQASAAGRGSLAGLGQRLRPLLRDHPRARRLLGVVALVALGLAAYTLLLGLVRIALGDVVLFRNASIVRPLLVGVAALLALGRPGDAVRALVAVAVLGVLPIESYQQTWPVLSTEHHPLRMTRDCLAPIAARHPGEDPAGSGVYVESDEAIHPFPYYLLRVGPWDADHAESDAAVYAAIRGGRPRPVLLSEKRYQQFVGRLAALDANAGVTEGRAWDTIAFARNVLLLPGPYRSCAAVQFRPGGSPK